jgi:hypothetical protein
MYNNLYYIPEEGIRELKRKGCDERRKKGC